MNKPILLATTLAVLAIAGLCSPVSGAQVRSPAHVGPEVKTNKPGYRVGEEVVISGAGFRPFEVVGLLVSHADGGEEANAGHERFFVTADADGSFLSSWAMDPHDARGLEFVVSADGTSSDHAHAEFVRTGAIASDRPSYEPGERARITAEGYNPNELVVIHANDAHDHELLTAVTDGNGRIDVDVDLPNDNSPGGLTITAKATESGLALTVSTVSFTGRIAYHSYVSYGDGTSQMFILNLATGALTNISASWTNLKDPMNGHWSPDGKKIVFMARPKKGGKYSSWFDVFLYNVGQSGNPVDLTNTPSLHDEDPKFSFDGAKIVYKVRPSTLVEMDLNGNVLNTIISGPGQERSMPYYSADGGSIWFTSQPSGDNSLASIHRIDVNGANDTLVVDSPGALDYYPIRDTVGQFLYTRWVSPSNLHDQVYMYGAAGGVSLPFNTTDADYADAFPIGAQHVVLSSTKAGGRGGFDLYIADRTTGAVWPVSNYNAGVNTKREELGASYTPTN